MLLIPERCLVVLQPPRTSATAVRDAALDTYPRAISLYRHMERPGLPYGYEAWTIACLIRNPLDRLVSLYRYMRDFRPTSRSQATAEWIARMAGDAAMPFADWLETSREVFTDPHDTDGSYAPYYAVGDRRPIVRKSQAAWARPDLGPVTLLPIETQDRLREITGLAPTRRNAAVDPARPTLCPRVARHLLKHFSWDLAQYPALGRACREMAGADGAPVRTAA